MSKWPVSRLGDLCDVQIGRTPRRDNPAYWGGRIPWVTVGELNGEQITETREGITQRAVEECMPAIVPAGTLMFSFKLSIGKMAVAGRPLYTNEAIAALPIRFPSRLDRDFLGYALSATTHEAAANDAVLGKVLNKEKVVALRVPLPPLAEQRRIVAILHAADNLRRLRAVADRRTADLIPALFHDMFGDPASVQERWPVCSLGDLGRVVTGNTPPRDNPGNYGEAIEWIKTDNIRPPLPYVTAALERLSPEGRSCCREVPPGTILVTCIAGSTNTIGNAAIADRPVAFNQQINAVVPRQDVDALFLYGLLQARKKQVQDLATGGLKRIVSKSQFERVRAFKPPRNLQLAFSRAVAHAFSLGDLQLRSRCQLDDLFQSLLHRAFSGELV